VGAFNASLLIAHEDSALHGAQHLENVWIEKVAGGPGRCGNGIFRVRGDIKDYTDLSCLRSPATVWSRLTQDSLAMGEYFLGRAANFIASSSDFESRAADFVNIESFVDMSPLHSLLREVLDPAIVYRSRKRLKIVATNWFTGQPYEFTNTDFDGDRGYRAIMASTAVPGIFPPVEVGKDVCVDGGLVQNTPLKPAIQLGATDIHVVYLNPNPQLIPLQGQPSTIDTLLRVYFMMVAGNVTEDIKTVQWINAGLTAAEHFRTDGRLTASEAANLMGAAYRTLETSDGNFRKISVHCYFPQRVLGGHLGMLDFERKGVIEMVEAGEKAALNHNCEESGCVMP
jgi:predicted acylesterase/phospholipase RssA